MHVVFAVLGVGNKGNWISGEVIREVRWNGKGTGTLLDYEDEVL